MFSVLGKCMWSEAVACFDSLEDMLKERLIDSMLKQEMLFLSTMYLSCILDLVYKNIKATCAILRAKGFY